jgi:hypothetical protein
MGWTRQEEQRLLDGVGSFGWQTLQRRCGAKTRGAIQAKIRRDYGGGGITRGTYSLLEAIQETGYSRTQLRRAAEALGQRWGRTAKGKNHTFLITGEQLEELVAWLSHDFWSKKLKLYGCHSCGTQTDPHYSFGCCLGCFKTLRRYALRLGLPFTAKALLDILEGKTLPHDVQRIHHNLKAGWAPTRDQLEVLWTFVGQ